MNILDWIIVVVMCLAAYGGWHIGLLARVFSWIGIGVGLYFGAKLAYLALVALKLSNPVLSLVVEVAIIASVCLICQSIGMFIGLKLSKIVGLGPLRLLDKILGAIFGFVMIVALVWILIPSLVNVNGVVSRQARTSKIVSAIGKYLPGQPASIRNFTQLVESGNFPEVFQGVSSSPYAGPPPISSPVSAQTISIAEASTVKVTGTACGYVLDGSGFSAIGNNLVVTNAHVIAGEARTTVITPNGYRLNAVPIAFDEKIDIAILRVPGLQRHDPQEVPLTLTPAQIGSTVVDLGHPGGVDQIVVAPAKVYSEVTATGRDLYNSAIVSRDIYILSAKIIQGDSGSPIVNSSGQAVGVVFALAPDQPSTGYALAPSEVRKVANEISPNSVSTGRCIAG